MEPEPQEPLGRLIACLHRQARSYFEHHLAPYRLGSGTLPVLLALLRHDGLNQQELSAKLLVDKATITRTITKLMKQGYVRREKDQADNRAYRLFTTPKAQAITSEINAILHAWNDILAEGLTSSEKDLAFTLLQQMRTNALQHKKDQEPKKLCDH